MIDSTSLVKNSSIGRPVLVGEQLVVTWENVSPMSYPNAMSQTLNLLPFDKTTSVSIPSRA